MTTSTKPEDSDYVKAILPTDQDRKMYLDLIRRAIAGTLDGIHVLWGHGSGNNGKTSLRVFLEHTPGIGEHMVRSDMYFPDAMGWDVKRHPIISCATGSCLDTVPFVADLNAVRLCKAERGERGLIIIEATLECPKTLAHDKSVHVIHFTQKFPSIPKTIVSVDTGNICLQSYPCQHYTTLTYSDGTKSETGILSSTAILKEYGKYLTEQQRSHMKECN